jgi:glutathione S-transferase
MLTVHHLNNSRSQRVLWLLEELGVPYDIRHHQRDPKTMLAPKELLQVHPLGKSPVIVDGDVTVAETGAIVEYILDQHGNGRMRPAPGTPDFLRHRYWLHFAEGSAMPPLLMKLVFDEVQKAKMPFFIKPVAKGISQKVMEMLVWPNLKRQFAFIEAELGRSTWLAGDALTGADIMMSCPLEAAKQRAGLTASSHPRIAAYIDRVHARPAYQRAIAKGGPYDFA